MEKKFNLKFLLVSFVIIVIIVFCTAFSVSYAKWVSDKKDSISVSVKTGEWRGWNAINDGIKIGDSFLELNGENCPSENWFNTNDIRIYCHFFINVKKDTKINFKFAGNDVIIIDDTKVSVIGVEFDPTVSGASLEKYDSTVKFSADSFYEITYIFYHNYEVYKPSLTITEVTETNEIYLDITGTKPIAKRLDKELGSWINGYYVPNTN